MLIDSHCHLDVDAFDGDRADVVRRARAAGVMQHVVPAIQASTWPALRAVCADDPGLHAAYGLHPVFLDRHRDAHLDQLRDWIERERPVAIGECGLDHFVDGLDRDVQQRYFDAQLRLAHDHDLPLIVHARRAVDAVIASIRRIGGAHGGLRGVIHSWSGSAQQAQQLWDHGFLLGVGGPVTYPRANRLRALVASMPLEHLLLETDSPDQPDAALQGERNEPARLSVVCQTVAELRGATADAIAEATTANARRLFGLPAMDAVRI